MWYPLDGSLPKYVCNDLAQHPRFSLCLLIGWNVWKSSEMDNTQFKFGKQFSCLTWHLAYRTTRTILWSHIHFVSRQSLQAMAPMNISHSLICHLLWYTLDGSLPKLCQMTLPFIPDGQHEKWKSLTIFFITTGYNENLNKKILGGGLFQNGVCLLHPLSNMAIT